MAQKTIPGFLNVFPRGKGVRQLLAVLLGAILLGILAGNVGLGASEDEDLPAAEARTALADLTDLSDPPADSAGQNTVLPGLGGIPSLTGVWVTLGLFALVGTATVLLLTRGRRFRAGNGSLHVVDSIPLGGRRLIHLIRCGDRKYLIGNSEKGIHYLASLPTDPMEQEVERVFERDEGEQTFEALLGHDRERA